MGTEHRSTRHRRRISALALAAIFPVVLLQELIDPISTFAPARKVALAHDHPALLWATSLLQLLAALLILVGVPGLVTAIRGRGAALANTGGLLALVGAMAYAHNSAYALFVLATRGGDTDAMAATIGRLDRIAGPLEFPLVVLFAVSLLFLAGAAWRAGLVPVWVFAVVAAAFALHLVPAFPGSIVAINGLALAGFGVMAWRLLPAERRTAGADPVPVPAGA